jgi:hypothetical protein
MRPFVHDTGPYTLHREKGRLSSRAFQHTSWWYDRHAIPLEHAWRERLGLARCP